MRRSSVIGASLAAAALAGIGSAASAQAAVQKLTYAITAPGDAVYKATCKFRAIKVKQAGLINSMTLSGKGPRKGELPTDNGRCTLTVVKSAGPVTLVIAGKGQRQTARVDKPGATGNVAIF